MTGILPRPARIAALVAIVVLAAANVLPGYRPSASAQVAVKKAAQLPNAPDVSTPAPANSPVPAIPPPSPSATGPTLFLPNGGFVSGDLVDSADGGTIRWRSPAFAGPLAFATNAVDAVRWPKTAQPPAAKGEYRFELAGGGLLSGSLISLDESAAEIEIPGTGRLHVDRSSLHRLHRRRDDTDLIHSGPNGLTGWTQSGPKDAWREESGQPIADQPGATIRADLGIPPKAVVEFELSWKGHPDFVLALGAGPDEPGLKRAFRFEVWGDGELVINREVETRADLAPLGTLAEKNGRAHLLAYLDQAAGRILVVAPDGRPLADLTVPLPTKAEAAAAATAPRAGIMDAIRSMGPKNEGGVALTNVKGDIRLENLQIGKWDGQAPRQVEPGRSRVHMGDGSIAYGEVVRLDAPAREFVLKGENGEESRIPSDKIADVFLSAPAVGATPRPLLAHQADGGRVGGMLRKIEGGAVEMDVPGVREPIRLPIETLRSLTFRPEVPPAPEKGGPRPGVLEAEGARLPGSMADSKAEGAGAAGALAWRPAGGEPAAIRGGIAARIVYAEPKPPAPPAAQPQPAIAAPKAVIAFNNLLGNIGTASARRQVEGRRALHLRTGDVIPCEVIAIEEAGVRIKSEVAPGSLIPHDKIKAIELAPLAYDSIKVGKEKRERLLTLPRMQKGSPPTQLVRSTNGDYLRGRVVAMDESTLQVEVRLDTKAVPRDRVARIIWFHADELGPPREAPAAANTNPPPADAAGPVRVQAVRSDGVRVTFHPEAQAGGVLSGTSDVLGACQVKLGDVDQLLIGPSIERTASQLAYGRWVLRDAEEPKFAKADGTGGGSPGSESPLVGKPAPDFTLDLLDGKKFHLAENQGHIVILDFWATWCGPCIQAMPQVERVAKEFGDRGVRLIAVNLQESPKDIKAMLERHKLGVDVALDRDGVVADKYAATAIPQTVIIDKAGGVARLFVGGGPDFEDRLREALKATLGGAEAEKK